MKFSTHPHLTHTPPTPPAKHPDSINMMPLVDVTASSGTSRQHPSPTIPRPNPTLCWNIMTPTTPGLPYNNNSSPHFTTHLIFPVWTSYDHPAGQILRAG